MVDIPKRIVHIAIEAIRIGTSGTESVCAITSGTITWEIVFPIVNTSFETV